MQSTIRKCVSFGVASACCAIFVACGGGEQDDHAKPSPAAERDTSAVTPAASREPAQVAAAAPSQPAPAPAPVAEPAAAVPASGREPDSFATQLESAKASAMTRSQRRGAVRDDIDAYLQREKLSEGVQTRNGSRMTVLIGEMATNKSPGERGFQLSRETAYQKAYLLALSNFLSQRAQTIENVLGSVLRNVTNDDMRALQQLCAQSSAERMSEKASQLAEALIDSALKKLDVEPDPKAERPAYTCPAQEELFHSMTSRRAAESISGLRVVHSSEIDGRVGVVLVHSSKFEDAARELFSGKFVAKTAGPDYVAETKAQMARSGMDAAALEGMFGVRMVKLASGESVIVAFGQADPDLGPSDSDRILDMKIDAAKRRAYNNAAAELARFARVTAVFTSDQDQWDNKGQYVDLTTGAKEDQASMAESLLEKINTSSRLDVQGVARIDDWEVDPEKDPTAQAVVGVILAWSPALQSTYGRDAAPTDAAEGAASGAGDVPEQVGDGTYRRKSADMKEDW